MRQKITIGNQEMKEARTLIMYLYSTRKKTNIWHLKRVVDFYPQIYGIVFATRKGNPEIADKLYRMDIMQETRLLAS